MRIIAQAEDVPVARTPEGGERRVLSYTDSMMLVQFTFEAGLRPALHSHPHEQVGYVISGEIDLLMEGYEPQRLTAGGSYYVAPNVRHGIITYTPAVLLDCFTPMREDFL